MLLGGIVYLSVGSANLISYKAASGDLVSGVPTDKKVIALTFDDGPDPVYTPQILDLLKHNHKQATFFIIGLHAKDNPDVLRMISQQGHEIGNHGYTHRRFSGKPKEFILGDLTKTADLIEKVTGTKPKLIRPPCGKISPELLEIVRENHLKLITWGEDPEDWKHHDSSYISSHILKNVKPGQIIVLHDGGGNRAATVQALAILLPALDKAGFELVTVGKLLEGEE